MKDSDLIFGLMASFKKKEYSFPDLLYLTAPLSVSEASLRTNLSRMSANRIVKIRKEGRSAFYSFGDKGSKIGSNVSFAFRKPDWSGWSDDWYGAAFSLPSLRERERYGIRKKLSAYRFAMLYPGFWIRPYNISETEKLGIGAVFLSDACTLISFKFHQKPDISRISSIWKLSVVLKDFTGMASLLMEKMACIDDYSPEEALFEKITVGNNVVKTLFKDPLLPEELLPDNWPGDKLRILFRKWDKRVTERAKPYWIRIIKEENREDT